MSKINDMERYVREARKHLAPSYDLTVEELHALNDMSKDQYRLIVNAFLVGYEKGCRATAKGYTVPRKVS